jgi:hypothetical protein
MKSYWRPSLFLLLAALTWTACTRGDGSNPSAKATGPELNDKTFPTLLHAILPTKGELRWQAIPWRAAFWDAVVEGAETDKPILLWTMNGNPLGCT